MVLLRPKAGCDFAVGLVFSSNTSGLGTVQIFSSPLIQAGRSNRRRLPVVDYFRISGR